MIGRIFAQRYKLEEFVGKGGMALVFRATDERTGHDVAIKVLRPEFNDDKEFLERFHREALAASKMSHHNIVNLLDVGEEDGFRYLVMEYMRGRTLKEIIAERGKLPETVAAQIAIRILSALQHAHNNGIIHRDIKPQNVLVNSEGLVKVADFGIARVAGSNTLSKGDSVMGSVHYFSPEQARGEDVTVASDIYSVGVVMYEMLTGKVPFDGDTPVSIAMQHISTPPKAPSLVSDGISPALEQVVLIAMSKEIRNRYRDAADMARAIRAALADPQGGELPMAAESGPVRVHTGDTARVSQRRRKAQLRSALILLAATVALMGSLAIGAYHIASNIWSVTEAPYLVGETEENALRIGRERDLKIEVVRQSDATAPAGMVIMQSREYQYRMHRGDVLVITVSTGPSEQGVPKVTGVSLAQAQEEARRFGFEVVAVERVESEQPYGTVLEQMPAEGEKTKVTIIQVIVSDCVTVPNFMGLTQSQALLLAQESNLKWQIVEQTTANAANFDRVADQLPKANDRVRSNTTVTLAIYKQAAETDETTAQPSDTQGN